ncbi:MAG: hypothetical protein J6I32_06535 [Bacteroidaceae bacterium]|nr:hypothetical protein [Bacteroidaceae bacterium]
MIFHVPAKIILPENKAASINKKILSRHDGRNQQKLHTFAMTVAMRQRRRQAKATQT